MGRPEDAQSLPLRTALRESPGVGRLAIVRFAGQFGDGMFQAALSGAILFNPERETDPLAVAAGFAVLLLPYSLIGPYAGALLDRWDRRAVLLVANVLRAALIGVVSVGLLAGVGETPLLLLALAVVGISRFVMAGVSAALPRVLAQEWLVPMNSVLATVASGCAGAGAAIAVAIIGVIGAGDQGSAVAVAVSATGSVLGAVLAAGFRPRVLGPEGKIRTERGAVRAIATGLRTGATAVWRSKHVTTAMVGIGTHRVVFGANTLIMVLVLRQDASGPTGGLIGFGVAIAATATGMLVAAVLAPLLIPRLGRPRTVVAGLVTAMLVQLTLVTPTALAAPDAADRAHQLLLAGAFLFGLAGQTIKLTGDATMQIDIDDDRRGQVFALQDTVFNITFVLAIAATALVVPADGRSLPVVLTGALGYAVGILAIALNSRRPTK
ncbi:MFS transporter [Nocardia puris]|nr:MFS transporter [Nocardia puris]MBF6213657.1 MFS transporter [Nocardia puris]MBF6365413.1 MFS transporter [Nocardia puris]MBF6459879.1 MFS transporter [Nocardia puris]